MEKVILFDMDGVLVNTEPLHFQLWKKAFREFGLEVGFEQYKGCIGSNNAKLMDLILEHYGLDFRDNQELPARYYQLKDEHLHHGEIPRIEGVQETLAELRRRGYRMAVASSSPQDYIELCMERLGLRENFEILFSAHRVPRSKPFPDVFLAAAEAMGATPAECVVVEDSTNGTLAAKAAGMRCLGFTNPDSGEQDLSAASTLFYPFDKLLELLP